MSDIFFDYELPPELIAQQPCAERDRARLLVVRRREGTLAHHVFADLPQLLAPGDLLVLNDTRVVPARLRGHRTHTGGKWEGLFLRALADGSWEMLCQTRGRLTPGETIAVDPGPLQLMVEGRTEGGRFRLRPLLSGTAEELLHHHGQVPLPPYIRKGRAEPGDRDRYQTVFAQQAGAIAAPTAGLHFTEALLQRLADHGIARTFVTLHVGPGTFQPIQVMDFRQHRMHREWGELSPNAAEALGACRRRDGRVVAVGTTAVRVLETVAATGPLRPWSGDTELFIHPPYEFQMVDALSTNFHLPRSTLLLLVGAFAGADLLRRAYKTAIAERYRFYSYGDAMLIL